MHESMNEITDVLQGGLETAKNSGASAAKLVFSRSENTACSFEDARLKTAYAHQGSYYSITSIVNGRRGSASSNDLDNLPEMVARSVSLAKAGSAAHFEKYPAPKETKTVKTYSKNAAKYISQSHNIDGQRVVEWAAENLKPQQKERVFRSLIIGDFRVLDTLTGNYKRATETVALGA